jgi:hypothetical protein
MIVETLFVPETIRYTGDQLCSHWAYEQFDLVGDSIVSFIGPCEVGKEKLVDLVDRKRNKIIYSESMLHFIIEHFDLDLEKTILKQKLLVVVLMEKLKNRIHSSVIHRLGDDLFDGDGKLTVSIATLTSVSTKIHTGINISSQNTPVKTKGLMDYGLDPRELAEAVMNQYRLELMQTSVARAKVRGLP